MKEPRGETKRDFCETNGRKKYESFKKHETSFHKKWCVPKKGYQCALTLHMKMTREINENAEGNLRDNNKVWKRKNCNCELTYSMLDRPSAAIETSREEINEDAACFTGSKDSVNCRQATTQKLKKMSQTTKKVLKVLFWSIWIILVFLKFSLAACLSAANYLAKQTKAISKTRQKLSVSRKNFVSGPFCASKSVCFRNTMRNGCIMIFCRNIWV